MASIDWQTSIGLIILEIRIIPFIDRFSEINATVEGARGSGWPRVNQEFSKKEFSFSSVVSNLNHLLPIDPVERVIAMGILYPASNGYSRGGEIWISIVPKNMVFDFRHSRFSRQLLFDQRA